MRISETRIRPFPDLVAADRPLTATEIRTLRKQQAQSMRQRMVQDLKAAVAQDPSLGEFLTPDRIDRYARGKLSFQTLVGSRDDTTHLRGLHEEYQELFRAWEKGLPQIGKQIKENHYLDQRHEAEEKLSAKRTAASLAEQESAVALRRNTRAHFAELRNADVLEPNDGTHETVTAMHPADDGVVAALQVPHGIHGVTLRPTRLAAE